MSAEESRNPYLPPTGGLHPSATSGRATLASIGKIAVAWCIIGACVVGVGTVAQMGFGLRRFGGEEFIPKALALSAVRVLGARVALGATCIAVAVSLREHNKRLALPIVLTVPALTGLGSLFILLAGGAACAAAFPSTARFYGSAWVTLRPADVAVGFARGLAFGVALAACLPAGLKLIRRYQHRFVRGFLACLLSWVVALPVGALLEVVLRV